MLDSQETDASSKEVQEETNKYLDILQLKLKERKDEWISEGINEKLKEWMNE